MSNITHFLNICLEPHKTHTARPNRTRSSTHDEFLKEAYRIAAHITSLQTYLDSIRQAYLSTNTAHAPPLHRSSSGSTQIKHPPGPHLRSQSQLHLTNLDRDAIDASLQLLLRDLSASLHQLSSAESLRRDTFARIHDKSKRGLGVGFLTAWAGGGDGDAGRGAKSEAELLEESKEETLAGVRAGVLWWLGRKVEAVAERGRGMVERRVRRELERGRSVLYLSKGSRGGLKGDGATVAAAAAGMESAEKENDNKWNPSEAKIDDQLTVEQMQLFASENRDMLRHYEDTLEQVRTAERSILEISQLQTTLAQNLDTQSANISQLVADSLSTTENVGMGNKELKRANERKSTAQTVFWASCGLCVVLIGWDLIF